MIPRILNVVAHAQLVLQPRQPQVGTLQANILNFHFTACAFSIQTRQPPMTSWHTLRAGETRGVYEPTSKRARQGRVAARRRARGACQGTRAASNKIDPTRGRADIWLAAHGAGIYRRDIEQRTGQCV